MIKFCEQMGWGFVYVSFGSIMTTLTGNQRYGRYIGPLLGQVVGRSQDRPVVFGQDPFHKEPNSVSVTSLGLLRGTSDRLESRVFWENGYRTVASIANADPKEILPVLIQAQPNKVRVKGKDNKSYEEKLLAKASVITSCANNLWSRIFPFEQCLTDLLTTVQIFNYRQKWRSTETYP